MPFIAGVLIIGPLISGLFSIHNGELADQPFWERSLHFFMWELFSGTDYVPGIDFAHFWFMWFLMILYVVHVLGRAVFWRWIRKINAPRGLIGFVDFCLRKNDGIFLLAGVTLIFHTTLRSSIFLPGEAHLDAALNDLGYYMWFYFFGVGLYHCMDFVGKLTRNLKGHLILVLADFWVHAATDTIKMHRPPVVDINSWRPQSFQVFWEGVFYGGPDRYLINDIRCPLCWALCFSMFAIGQRFFSKRDELIRYFADASYWVYWVHLPVMFSFSVVLQSVGFNTLFKACLAILISTALVLYVLFVGNTILGDFFCGWRKPMKDEPSLRLIRGNWKALAMRAVGWGGVIFTVGELIHVSLFRKNAGLQMLSSRQSSDRGMSASTMPWNG